MNKKYAMQIEATIKKNVPPGIRFSRAKSFDEHRALCLWEDAGGALTIQTSNYSNDLFMTMRLAPETAEFLYGCLKEYYDSFK